MYKYKADFFYRDEFKGSISHTLVDTIECLNSQFDYYKLDMANDEIVLLEVRKHYYFVLLGFYKTLYVFKN